MMIVKSSARHEQGFRITIYFSCKAEKNIAINKNLLEMLIIAF